jgi:hypothetical protein
MTDQTADLESFPEETGAATGDARENAVQSPGFTEVDRLFRSHFQRANRMADQSYDRVRDAYAAGAAAATDPAYTGRSFTEMEEDLQTGWLSVRRRGGDWTSVRAFAEEGFRIGRAQGTISDATESASTGDSERKSYADPLADGMDPTAPERPVE